MIDYRRLEKVRKYAVKMGFAVTETRVFENAESTEAMLTLVPASGEPAADEEPETAEETA